MRLRNEHQNREFMYTKFTSKQNRRALASKTKSQSSQWEASRKSLTFRWRTNINFSILLLCTEILLLSYFPFPLRSFLVHGDKEIKQNKYNTNEMQYTHPHSKFRSCFLIVILSSTCILYLICVLDRKKERKNRKKKVSSS